LCYDYQMSDIGERMLSELQRIRETLELTQPLGFGKRQAPQWLNVWLQQVGEVEYVWYFKSKTGTRDYRSERDLTGYLVNLWRYESVDKQTGIKQPKLVAHIHAGKDYFLRTGFYTNFSQTLMAGLLELPELDLTQVPLTFVAESFAGTRANPTVFCRIEFRGTRMTVSEKVEHKVLLEQLQSRFGFKNPLELPDSDGEEALDD
jgi:hypothetical protein